METEEMAERITTAAAEATAAVGRLNYLSTREELEEACTLAGELRDAFQAAAEKLPAGLARRAILSAASKAGFGLEKLLDGPRPLAFGVNEAAKAAPLIVSRMTAFAGVDADLMPRRLRRAVDALRKLKENSSSGFEWKLFKTYTANSHEYHTIFAPECKEVFEALWNLSALAAEGPARDELRLMCGRLSDGLAAAGAHHPEVLEHHVKNACDMAELYADILDAFAEEE